MSRKPKKTNARLTKRLAAYSGAATAALVASQATNEAQAVIQYSGPQNTAVVDTTVPIDLNGDGINDIQITHQSFTQTFTNGFYNSANSFSNFYSIEGDGGLRATALGGNGIGGYLSIASRFSTSNRFGPGAGDVANGTMAFRSHWSTTYSYATEGGASSNTSFQFGFSTGNWAPAPTTGFLGVRFDIDGSDHYGWVRVTSNQPRMSGTIVDWAWEDVAGEGIHIGSTSGGVQPPDPSPVPEPAALGFLALGAVGVAATRRRRREVRNAN